RCVRFRYVAFEVTIDLKSTWSVQKGFFWFRRPARAADLSKPATSHPGQEVAWTRSKDGAGIHETARNNEMLEYTDFKVRGRTYRHIDDGWAARQVTCPGRQTCWRLYWGCLRPGASAPTYVTAHTEDQGSYTDLATFADCVRWVEVRRAM